MDDAAKRGLDAEMSVKLTQLGLDLIPTRRSAHMRAPGAARGASSGGRARVWIDMEGSGLHRTRRSPSTRSSSSDHANVGLCLQAYLKRTYSDVERLLPLTPRIRLVKGAYAEPPEIAYQSRREVDANYLALCVSMLARGEVGP